MTKHSFRVYQLRPYCYVHVMDDFGNDRQIHRNRVNHFISQTH